MRRLAAAFTFLVLLSACQSVRPPEQLKPRPQGDWIAWDADTDGSPRTYERGGYHLTLAKVTRPDGLLAPELIIADDKGEPLRVMGAGGGSRLTRADVGVFALDRRSPRPQVLLRSFTYGAHCCFRYKLAERRDGAWVVHDLDAWDGAGRPEPMDLDGDGRLELSAGDQRFLYAFESYAGSPVPPRIFEVVDGQLIDVSTAPRFRPIYVRVATAGRRRCAETASPGSCLEYAASMARLGRLEEAWVLVGKADPELRGDHAADDCWGGRTVCLADGRKVTVGSFREKVRLFLADLGYIPQRTS